MKMTEVAHIFGTLHSVVKFMPEFRQKMSWATFWANFSKNSSGHLEFARPSKIYPNCDYWSENIPSGSPGSGARGRENGRSKKKCYLHDFGSDKKGSTDLPKNNWLMKRKNWTATICTTESDCWKNERRQNPGHDTE
jgi:hypothetical protein